MKKPMTTEELFNKIYGILKEKDKLPDVLDYGLSAGNALPIKTGEFELKSELAYGASEGIYLDLWIRYLYEDAEYKKDLGTFKTLRDDGEAMHMMASLLADFIIELNDYVHANIDDFSWEGADVHVIDESGKRADCVYSCVNMKYALRIKDELLEKYAQVVIRDNATRKEKIFCRDTEEKKGVLQGIGSGI